MGILWRGAPWAALLFCFSAQAQVRVTAPTLPAGLVGNTYGTVETPTGALQLTIPRYTASGGTAPYTFRISAGALPPGMSLGTGGGLLGAPTATGSFSFEVRATDAAQQSATVQSAITVGARPKANISGRVGTPLRLERKCGVDAAAQATFTYAINGTPPPGVTFDAAASLFQGTPTTEGTYTVIWGCSSQVQGTAFSIEHIFTIGGVARISLNPGTVGRPYSFTPTRLAAGQPPYQFALSAGSLPPGMALTNASLGTISGTPTTDGRYSWTLRRTDSAQNVLTVSYDMTVNAASGFQPSLSAWNITRRVGDPPISLDVFVEGTPQAQAYELSVESSGGAWLVATPPTGQISGRFRMTVNVAGIAPGNYTGKVRISKPAAGGGPEPAEVPVNLEVQPGGPPRLRVSTSSARLGPQDSVQITVTNVGGDTARDLRTTASSSGNWLGAGLSANTLAPGQSTTLRVSSNGTGLPAGTYQGTVRIAGSNLASGSLPATMTIRPVASCSFEPSSVTIPVNPSNTTLSYFARIVAKNEDGSPSSLKWELKELTLFELETALRLPEWLVVTPTTGEGTTPIEMTVLVGRLPDEFKIGEHLKRFTLTSKGCDNSLTINVHIQGAVAPQVVPSSYIFPTMILSQSTELPPPAVLDLMPANPEPVGYKIAFYDDPFTNQSAQFFTFDPKDGEVRGEKTPIRVTTSATQRSNHGGPHKVTLLFTFNKLGRNVYGSQWIPVIHPVYLSTPPPLPPPPPGLFWAGEPKGGERRADECTADSLFVAPLMAEPVQGILGVPMDLRVLAMDSCGRPMTEGGIEADVSTGEGVVALTHQKDGIWSGVWTPKREAEAVSLSVKAVFRDLTASEQIGGSVRDPSALPVLNEPGGVRNAASELARGVVSPGMMLAVRGRRLAKAKTSVEAGAQPAENLSGTQVLLGTQRLPLYSVDEDVVVAVVPADRVLDPQVALTLVTEEGPSLPVSLLSVATTPGLYSVDGTGAGQGLVYWRQGDSAPKIAAKDDPAPAGAELIIPVTGLGAVDPETGLVKSPVTVRIGDIEVTSVRAAPREGRPGEYEVRFTRPEGTASGPEVPLLLSAGDGFSQTVTIALK